MNCQDIARVIDSSTISPPGSAEFRACEEHARSCRHCAELWFAHARLFAEPIPAMPPELSVRCLTLAAAKAPAPVSRHRSRMIVAVVGLVALAAAAMMLSMNFGHDSVPEVQSAVDDPPREAAGVPPSTPIAPVPGSTETPADNAPAAAKLAGSVPLLPAPLEIDRARTAWRNQALQKLVELYPELVQGQPTDEVFRAVILLRENGKVIGHAMRMGTRDTTSKAMSELHRHVPTDALDEMYDEELKGTRLPDGRILRGLLAYQHTTVPDSYDPSRSNLQVEDLLLAQRASLLLPISNADVNFVTVLLTEGGAIKAENVELVPVREKQRRIALGAAERAQEMARRLGVSIEQIGLMGISQIVDEANARTMFVDYAWQRRASESAPVFRQGGHDDVGVDLVAASALVESVMPDAFMGGEVERVLGLPVIILTEEGRVIRTGRRKETDPLDMERQVDSLVPDLFRATAKIVTLTNSKGEKTKVFFIWQASPATREAMEKERRR